MSSSVVTLGQSSKIQSEQNYNMEALAEEISHSEDPLRIQQLTRIVIQQILKLQSIEFQTSLRFIVKIIGKGYSAVLLQSSELVKKMMRCYVSISKQFKKKQTNELYYRSLFVLSIVAELIRQENKCLIPFSHEFLRQIFQYEIQDMTLQEQKNKLLAILTTIYSNLLRQSALIKELKVGKRFKQILLHNYSLAVQSSTIKQMNQIILHLQTKGIVCFTFNELQKYGIKSFLLKTLTSQKAQVMLKYLQKIFPRIKKEGL